MMVWEFFFLQWTMELQEMQRQMSASYIQMLQRASLMPEVPHLCGTDWIFFFNKTTTQYTMPAGQGYPPRE